MSEKEKKERKTGFTRKYRPTNVDTYVGNKVTKNKLISMIKNNRLPQTMLFEGDRGCGKTTMARIMAKTILCENPTSDGIACDTCKSCVVMTDKYILTGEVPAGLNVHEIDITKMNSTADASKLVDQMKVKPMGGKKKVYILDEIQRASPEAQNSYLKISEEPGDYLYIILCTTDPEDLIDPFKSRFSSLKIKRPSVGEIVDRLEEICQAENIKYDITALRLIALHQNRVPRECIMKLDEIAVGGEITYAQTSEELHLVSSKLYQDYFKNLSEDIYDAMKFIEDLYDVHGVDYNDFLGQLADFTLDAFNMKISMHLEKYTEEEYKAVRKIMKNYSARDLGRFLGLIEEAMRIKDNPRYALTLLTLKMGYEDYLNPTKAWEAAAEIKQEENIAQRAYMAQKEKEQKKRNDMVLEEQQTNIEDLLSILPGASLVELDGVSLEEKTDEEKKKELEEIESKENEKSIDFNIDDI